VDDSSGIVVRDPLNVLFLSQDKVLPMWAKFSMKDAHVSDVLVS
jgi:hypothetical protein